MTNCYARKDIVIGYPWIYVEQPVISKKKNKSKYMNTILCMPCSTYRINLVFIALAKHAVCSRNHGKCQQEESPLNCMFMGIMNILLQMVPSRNNANHPYNKPAWLKCTVGHWCCHLMDWIIVRDWKASHTYIHTNSYKDWGRGGCCVGRVGGMVTCLSFWHRCATRN